MFFTNIILLTYYVSYICSTKIPDSPKDVDVEHREQIPQFDIEFELIQPLAVDVGNENSIDVTKPSEEYLDFERRRIIALKYLEKLESGNQGWIDPFDMGSFSLTKKSEIIASKTSDPEITSTPTTINKKKDPSSLSNAKKEELCTTTSAISTAYISRWLKILLLRIEKESGSKHSYINFQLDSDTLDKLKEMSSPQTFEMAMLDDMLSNLLAQAVIKQKESYFAVAYTHHKDILKLLAYVSGIAVFIYYLHHSVLRRPKLTLLVCGLVISIAWHWMHLYQKIKAHKHAELSSMQIPSQCMKHDLGLLEHIYVYFKNFFTASDCTKYYEALLVDPVWEVSLSVAALEAVTATLFQPLFASSRAVNSFLKQLFDGLPMYLTVFVIIFIFFVTLMKFGYAIKLPFFMGRIEPCHLVAGSRVQELECSKQLSNSTDTVPNAVTAITSRPTIMSTAKPSCVFVDGLQFPPVFSKESVKSAQNYRPRDDDVIVATYPKCGTTWIQVMLALIFGQGDLKEARRLLHASPFLELKGSAAAESMPRPGFIKTHLVFRRAPWSDKAKYIFVARNPKDSCVSYYYHHKGRGYSGSFDDFFELFIRGDVNFGDYFDHLTGWYEHRNKPNILFLTYEEMKQDTARALLKIASFIDDEKYAEPLRRDNEKLDTILKFCSLDHIKEVINDCPEESEADARTPEKLKERSSTDINRDVRIKNEADFLVRKGVTGDWRNHFTEEQSKRMDDKFAQRMMDYDIGDIWKNYM